MRIVRSTEGRLRRLAARHRLIALVLAAAMLLRVAVAVAYWPALVFQDS